jgi:hypothetical protein
VLLFPAGNYITTGGFTLANPTNVVGFGKSSDDLSQYLSQITVTSGTSNLFTVTAKVGNFSGLAMVNTNSAPTSGSAVFTNGSVYSQSVSYDDILVSGFYTDLHIGVGENWTLRDSTILDPVQYAVYVQNTVLADAGDWSITNSYISTEIRNSSAGIYIDSSGGGRITNNKFNGGPDGTGFAHAIQLVSPKPPVTQQLLISNNDIENTTDVPIYIPSAWSQINITDNYIRANANTAAIYVVNANGLYIGGGTIQGTSTQPWAIFIGDDPGNLPISTTIAPSVYAGWTLGSVTWPTGTTFGTGTAFNNNDYSNIYQSQYNQFIGNYNGNRSLAPNNSGLWVGQDTPHGGGALWSSSTAPTDEKLSECSVYDGLFYCQFMNDTLTVNNNWMSVLRSGATPTGITFYEPMTVSGSISAGAGSTDLNGSGVPESHCLADGTGCGYVRGTLSLTAATSDTASITGVTSSSVCTFSPENATAAAATVIAYVSAVSTGSVTITHAATVASGGTLNIICTTF